MRYTLAHAQEARADGLRIVVTLDGRDVTGACRWADPDRGVVCLLLRDDCGHPFAIDGEIAVQYVRGVVDVLVVRD